MNKLEKKLQELGYIKSPKHSYVFNKEYIYDTYKIVVSISISSMTDKEGFHLLGFHKTIYTTRNYYYSQQDIDNLQQAFNEMQRDLEILKECEE